MEDRGKRKVPSIPANYLSIHDLQERWIREQQRKQREREEEEEEKQQQRKQREKEEEEEEQQLRKQREKEEEEQQQQLRQERVFDKPQSGSERLKDQPIKPRNRSSRRYNRRKGRHNLKASHTATAFVATVGEGSSKEEHHQTRAEYEEDQVLVGEEHAPPPRSAQCENVPARRYRRKKGAGKEFRPRTRNAVEDQTVETEGEVRGLSMNNARAENEEELVIRDEEKALPPSSFRNQTENVPARRGRKNRGIRDGFKPRIRNAVEGETGEIEGEFRGLSMNPCTRRGNKYFNHGNSEFSRSYGRLGRFVERNPRNAGMVWVKKEEVSKGNVSGIKSSSFLSMHSIGN